MVDSGQLIASDMVWCEEWDEWRLLVDSEEFKIPDIYKLRPPPLPSQSMFKNSQKLVTQLREEQVYEIARGVTITFCWCPPGDFLMGYNNLPKQKNPAPPVNVSISKGFWMSKTQVTQLQWAAIMGDNPSHFKGVNLPVEEVSWYKAQDFIQQLNGKDNISDGRAIGLPTEAQWEYAARAGDTGLYSGGGNIEDLAWYNKNSCNSTHRVGAKIPNAWGLHDMSGNVMEWCNDWYSDKLIGGIDPLGPTSGSHRVSRGGDWSLESHDCCVAKRYSYSPHVSYSTLGFRVVRNSVS
jgi:formylglycine-generating enzyme required for sulfatase activity